jgi:rare lipoprotein A
MRRLTWLAALAVLITGCGTTPGARIWPLPKPGTPAAKHPAIDPDLPVLPAAGSGRGGYYQDDGPGDNPPPNLKDVPDAEVRAEPYSKYANRPYTVFGKTYTPIVNDEPFTQRGVSSWYGKKFHGQRTSSGELYDMYKMTAAHPTLPIPSFARVTSVASGKQVVVRINDRGPFHASRIIDVSFTAALKLGLLGKGSHEVEVERLLPNQPEKIATLRRNAPEPSPEAAALMLEQASAPTAPAPAAAGGFYLQLGAYKLADKAAQVRARLAQYIGAPASIEVIESGALHRLFGGPFASRAEAAEAARSLPAALGLKPIVVRR